jgi:putative transposase
MTWRLTKVEELREYLVKSYISKLAGMSELCEECGVSRKTGYKWYYRYLESGAKGLEDSSRAPKCPKKKYKEEVISTALNLKHQYPKYGPKKIYAMLCKKHPLIEWPSPTRLYEVFKEYHLVCSRKLRRRVQRTHPLGEVNFSNDVWCADFKGWFLTGDKQKVEPFTVTDGYSRYVICCQHLERKTFENVWKAYSNAFNSYGLPTRIRTDNGPPFATTGAGRLSRLSINLIKAGVIPEWINPGHPEENGRHERFHRSLKEEIANPPASSFNEQVLQMQAFVEDYNFERPHEAIDQQTPGSIYTPSNRQWDGKLRSPEYDIGTKLRKVGSSGCINYKQVNCYVAQILEGEYVRLEQFDNDAFNVHYGPIFLGVLVEGNKNLKRELIKPR